MKSKKLVVSLLVMLAVVMSTLTFAYWATGISGNSDVASNTIQIGSGDAVTTTVAVSDSASSALDLVPVGREESGTSVSSITYTFDVVWAGTSSASDTAGATGDLSAAIVLSGADASELALFTVSTYTGASVTYGDTTQVTVTVTFTNEPADQAQYNLIANAELNLSVTFTIDNVVEA
jgi:hypothetical protein